jgi:hypothetical protein
MYQLRNSLAPVLSMLCIWLINIHEMYGMYAHPTVDLELRICIGARFKELGTLLSRRRYMQRLGNGQRVQDSEAIEASRSIPIFLLMTVQMHPVHLSTGITGDRLSKPIKFMSMLQVRRVDKVLADAILGGWVWTLVDRLGRDSPARPANVELSARDIGHKVERNRCLCGHLG